MWTMSDKFYLTKIHCGWIDVFLKNNYDDDDDDDDDSEDQDDDNDDDDGDRDNGCEVKKKRFFNKET